MSVSATLQFAESGGGLTAFLAENLKDIYTVLDLDYTVEKPFDKSGRPSSGAYISLIKVTIRAAKQMGAPFHDWINKPDQQMDGVIKIYDSSSILVSSSLQDAVGINPLLDVNDTLALPETIMEREMSDAMEDERKNDLYDETSHEDLLKQAKKNNITVLASDSDDVIRDKLRQANKEYEKLAKDDDAMKKFMKDNKKNIKWPSKENETKDLTLEQLQEYVQKKKLDDAPKKEKNESDEEYLKRYRKFVQDDMELEAARELVKERPEEVTKAVGEMADKDYKDIEPALQKVNELKKQTTSTVKGVANELAKRALECARSISFTKAYCVGLKEHFTNRPDSQGKLDSTYPWTIEISIRPTTVTVTGEKLGPKAVGGEVQFT